uniref:Ovule protein n=1 Tax=Angiostrongylus cantonensis TaxID=6313 RepID=A0A0K0D1C0_ANGCA
MYQEERAARCVHLLADPTPNVMLNSIVDNGEMSVRHLEFENREITLNQRSVDGNINSTSIEPRGNFDIYGQQFPNVYDHQNMSYEGNSAQIFNHVNTYGLYPMDTSFPYQDAEKGPEINEDVFDHFGFRTQYPTWNNFIINDPNDIYTSPVLQESYSVNDYSVEKSNSLMHCAPQYFTSNEIPGLPFVPDGNEIPELPSANETLMGVRTSNVPGEPIECCKNEVYKRYVVETASQNLNECEFFTL